MNKTSNYSYKGKVYKGLMMFVPLLSIASAGVAAESAAVAQSSSPAATASLAVLQEYSTRQQSVPAPVTASTKSLASDAVEKDYSLLYTPNDSFSVEAWHRAIEPIILDYVKSGGQHRKLVESVLKCPYRYDEDGPYASAALEQLVKVKDLKAVPAFSFLIENMTLPIPSCSSDPAVKVLFMMLSVDFNRMLPLCYKIIERGERNMKVYMAEEILSHYPKNEKALKVLETEALNGLEAGYYVPQQNLEYPDSSARFSAALALKRYSPRWRQYMLKIALEDKSEAMRTTAIKSLVSDRLYFFDRFHLSETNPEMLDVALALMMDFMAKDFCGSSELTQFVVVIYKKLPEKQEWIIDEMSKLSAEADRRNACKYEYAHALRQLKGEPEPPVVSPPRPPALNLDINIINPTKPIPGRSNKFGVFVKNNEKKKLENLILYVTLPEGSVYTSASHNAKYGKWLQTIWWPLTLNPGQTYTGWFSVKLPAGDTPLYISMDSNFDAMNRQLLGLAAQGADGEHVQDENGKPIPFED